MERLAPIALFVYKRPEHTRRTLESLWANAGVEKSDVFIFCDAPAAADDEAGVKAVRKLIRTFKKGAANVEIIEADTNQGLARSIIEGVTRLTDAFGRVIVVEDDLELSPGFVAYMNDALEIYADAPQVMHVGGYMPPVKGALSNTFFHHCATPWGWATWKRAWRFFNPDATDLYNKILEQNRIYEFNADGSYDYLTELHDNVSGKLRTWAVKWHASVFLQNGLCLYPGVSLVQNIGNDGSGVHCPPSDAYFIPQLAQKMTVERLPLRVNPRARKAIRRFYLQKSGVPAWKRLRSDLMRALLPYSIIRALKK